MLLLKILTVIILFLIFLQDLKDRAVYWFLFPLVAVILIGIRTRQQPVLSDFILAVVMNMGLIGIQLLILTIWFSLKTRKWVNITTGLLGLGDILFLLSVACYLSVLNFLFFYIVSLSSILILWLVRQLILPRKNKYIPLAGLQSLAVIGFLLADWWFALFNLTDDAWLLNLIAK